MSDQALPQDRFLSHWLGIFGVVFLVVGIVWQVSRIPSRPSTPVPPAQSDWFLLLRMPAVTAQYESGIDTMRVRYGEWLDSLRQAGFKPMLLSDVYNRLRTGQGVPARTVVLVFDPGFRRTYKIVGPILASHGWPALWMTPVEEMGRGHREYVTYHQTRQMASSGWWDIGLTQRDGGVSLRSQNGPEISLGSSTRPLWSTMAGGTALNQGTRFEGLQRLNVIADWTADDLVNRTRVEVPIDGPAYLTLGRVQNLIWGMTSSLDSPEEKHFDLATPMHRRGIQVAWFGAKRIPNFRMDAEAEGLVGQLALRLRWNELDDTGIIVTASNREVVVQSKGDEHTLKVRQLTRSGAGPHGPLKLSVEIHGQSLSVSVDGRSAVEMELPPKTPTQGGLVQFYLYDVLKGSARLDSMKCLFTPLMS